MQKLIRPKKGWYILIKPQLSSSRTSGQSHFAAKCDPRLDPELPLDQVGVFESGPASLSLVDHVRTKLRHIRPRYTGKEWEYAPLMDHPVSHLSSYFK